MIKIEDVTIANFRSFKNQNNKINNLAKINVMVGKNNVGKTNALRAIYLFFNPETYDYTVDKNMIKQITRGQSDDPKISISVTDDEVVNGEIHKYSILCDLNDADKKYYSVVSRDQTVIEKLSSSAKIEKYIERKIKCVYLSTTDEDIDKQSENLINDLILKYYKKQNRKVKKTIEDFEKQYKSLMQTFKDNIQGIEDDLAKQFIGMNDSNVMPKLSINPSKDITRFLLENVKLQLDDSYSQDIGSKGAGIQRSSLVMLTIYLLSQIYVKENKIILLDEPEAFLYPLLERNVKKRLEDTVYDRDGMQIFMTSHSRTYLSELNNDEYSFSFLRQEIVQQEYSRSKNDFDINKYTVVEPLNRKNKYQTLKNYGLLDEVNDYEYVIVCEGETDKNYIYRILIEKDDIPQIRYGKYSDGVGGKVADINYDYIGKGATACLPILSYLDKISDIHRNVLVVLDGDEEGRNVAEKIHTREYPNLNIEKIVLPKGKEIEDVVFSKEAFAKRVIEVTPDLKPYAKEYERIITELDDRKSVVEQTEQFITGNAIANVNIYKIKNLLSQNLDGIVLESEWLLEKATPFFYAD